MFPTAVARLSRPRCQPLVQATRQFRSTEDRDSSPSAPKSLVLVGQRRFARSSWRGPNVNSNFWQKCIGVGAAGYATIKVLPGLKFAVPLLKIAKVGPLASMVVSGFAYGAVFGWSYGFGMVGLIAIHEAGHALMMRYLNVPVGPMIFIPFMGASVIMEKFPMDASEEAAIALAGPILGSIASLVPLAYGIQTHSQLAFALANWGFMINLFNLAPVGSLDGGRVAGCLNKWLLPVGLVGMGSLAYMLQHPMIYLVTALGTYTTFNRFYYPQDFRPIGYYDISMGSKIAVGATYIGLIATLVYAMKYNDKRRRTPQELLGPRSPVSKRLNDVDHWI